MAVSEYPALSDKYPALGSLLPPQQTCFFYLSCYLLASSATLKPDLSQTQPAAMKQKIVIRVDMPCDKCRSKAMALVAATVGVDSVALAGDGKDQVVVVGDGIDSVRLTTALRKKVGHAQLVQVGEVKEEEKKKPAEAASVVEYAYPWHYYQYPAAAAAYGYQQYHSRPDTCWM